VTGLSGGQAYLAILGVLLICGLGVPIPEDITLFTAGFLAYKERISLSGAFIIGFIGVLSGDAFLYLIGRNFGRRVFGWPVFRRLFTLDRIHRAERHIQKNGRIICFTARFMPGLRAPVFLTSGILRVPFPVFLGMDGLAALISVPVWIYLAYHFGNELETLFAVAEKAKIILVLGIILLIGGYVYRRYRKKRRLKG